MILILELDELVVVDITGTGAGDTGTGASGYMALELVMCILALSISPELPQEAIHRDEYPPLQYYFFYRFMSDFYSFDLI